MWGRSAAAAAARAAIAAAAALARGGGGGFGDGGPASGGCAQPKVAAAPPIDDRSLGAFSERGPWQLEIGRLTWQSGIDALRVDSQAQVPDWIRRRRIPPLGRFARAATSVGGALAGWWLVERRRGGAASRAGLSRRLRVAFDHLGSSYIKLAQIVSSGS